MKKLLLSILLSLLLVVPSYAAWTITADIVDSSDLGNGSKMYVVKISATSDNNDVAEFNLSSYLDSTDMGRVRGSSFIAVETDPGTAPDAVYPLAFNSQWGANILDLAGLSTTATEINDAATDLGFYFPIFGDLAIDIGDNNNQWTANDTVDIYLYFSK